MRLAGGYPDRIGTKAARAQLAMLLAGATDSRLASFTADSLAAMHRVRFGEVAEMLQAERGRRGYGV